MKLSKKNTLLVSFMLFSMFFGAGNLIFPPFLGQNAGTHTIGAFLGFLMTAVILPILGIFVIAQFDGLSNLSQKVGKTFAFWFTILIYLSIGPGLGIPRAASVPFEMAVAPYLPEDSSLHLWMLGYSLVFFLIVGWLCINPQKLMDRMGQILTPVLLILLILFFAAFLFKGETAIAQPQPAYQNLSFMQGFIDGYQTLDTIAALNFGLVIATTLTGLGLSEKKSMMRGTVLCGVLAGSILTVVYLMLTYMGAASSGVYTIGENGAFALRQIVYQVFGAPGAILLAAIFTIACLTTCVGLVNSISLFFSELHPRLKYRTMVILIIAFSFIVCNQGLTAILSISVPILNAIYPIAIVLILLGLTDRWHQGNHLIYPMVVTGTGIVSIVFGLKPLLPLHALERIFSLLPLYAEGFGWVTVSCVMVILSILLHKLNPSKKTD